MSSPFPLPAPRKVLLHLSEHRRTGDAASYPLALTQEGIASRTRLNRAHAAQALGGLKERGAVEEQLGHIEGETRRRKVYLLTPAGQKEAEALLASLMEETVSPGGAPAKVRALAASVPGGGTVVDLLIRAGRDGVIAEEKKEEGEEPAEEKEPPVETAPPPAPGDEGPPEEPSPNPQSKIQYSKSEVPPLGRGRIALLVVSALAASAVLLSAAYLSGGARVEPGWLAGEALLMASLLALFLLLGGVGRRVRAAAALGLGTAFSAAALAQAFLITPDATAAVRLFQALIVGGFLAALSQELWPLGRTDIILTAPAGAGAGIAYAAALYLLHPAGAAGLFPRVASLLWFAAGIYIAAACGAAWGGLLEPGSAARALGQSLLSSAGVMVLCIGIGFAANGLLLEGFGEILVGLGVAAYAFRRERPSRLSGATFGLLALVIVLTALAVMGW